MTPPDADDARLMGSLELSANPDCWKAADLIKSQRREIEELRREVAEALKVIAPFAKVDPRWIPSEAFIAASAFAAKHGGRDG